MRLATMADRAHWTRAALAATGAAVGMGLYDAVTVVARSGAPIALAAWATSAGLALGLAILPALALGALGRRLPVAPSARRDDAARAARTLSEMTAAAVVLASLALCAVLLRGTIRTPALLALAVGVLAIPALGLAVAAAAVARRLGERLPRLLASPARLLAAAAGAAALALLAGAILFPDTAEAIGLRPVVAIAVALGGALGGRALSPRILGSRRAPRAVAIGLVLLAAAPFAALPRAPRLRAALVFDAPVSPILVDAWTFLLDVDRDGALSVLGGGDCAPFDPGRGPSALDTPDDGIDQDCDGRDLRARDLLSRTGRHRPVPPALVKKRPVILVTADALRPDHLGCYGYRRPTSPGVDRFARRALRFEHAYAHGPSTRFSIPTLLTSRYTAQIHQNEHGRLPRPLHAENRMLAEILKSEGYRTVAVLGADYFVAWAGLRDGFDVFETRAARPDEHGQTSAKVADLSIDRIREAGRDPRPFFLWAHFYDTHSPYRAAPGGPDFGRASKDRYDAEIAQQDRHVGRLLDAVMRHLADRDPVVIFTSDHGEAFGEHGRGTHGFDLFEETTRVPLLVSLPSGRRGVSPELAGLADVVPTLADLVGVRDRSGFEGRSFAAHLAGAPPDPGARVHGELSIGDFNPRHLASVHAGRLHLVVDYTLGVSRLHDFVADPAERRALDPERTPGAAGLRRDLDAFRRRVVLSGQQPLLARALGTRAPTPSRPISARLGDVLELVGWDLVPERPRRGDQGFHVVLHARVLRTPTSPLKILLELTSGRGASIDGDHVSAGGYLPATAWTAGNWLEDRVFLFVRSAEPAGPWTIRIGLGENRDDRLPSTGQGAADGWVTLGEIEVR